MKKKIFVLIMCACTILVLFGCSSDVSYEGYDFNDYIELGKYKGLDVKDYTIDVTREDVEERIKAELSASSVNNELEEGAAIADGDTVNIDYEGKINGETFEGGTAQGTDLTIGSGSFIDGFETGLIDKKVGETVDLNLKFPEDYHAENLKGKDVVFTVKINSATRPAEPEYDLDYILNTTEYESIEEYEKALEKELYEEKENSAIAEQKDELWSKVLSTTKVKKYPDKELEQYIQLGETHVAAAAEESNVKVEEIYAGYGFGSKEEFDKENKKNSEFAVKQEMVILAIAENENIEYTEKEKKEQLETFKNAGYTEEYIKYQTGRSMDEYMNTELLYQKVTDFILKNANVVK